MVTPILITVKVDVGKQTIVVDEEINDISDVEELKENIPDTQPRYVLLSWKIEHSDGRVSYPMAFLYTTPRGKPLFSLLLCTEFNGKYVTRYTVYCEYPHEGY